MKKVIFKFCLLFCVVFGLFGCVNEKHTHSFTEQIVEDQYLVSEATCTEAANYYYSCTCGEKGTLTFESGKALGHSFTNYVSDGNATCLANGTKSATCDHEGCSATDTIVDEDSIIDHIYGEIIYEIKSGTNKSSATIVETIYCKMCEKVISINNYNIILPSKSFNYDGQKKSLCLEGDALPERIKPIYEGNDKVSAGDYVVNVMFEDIETETIFTIVLEAELKINDDGKYHEVVFVFDEVQEDIVSIAVKHGDKINPSQFPQLPEKKGYNVEWNYDELEILKDTTISILYTPIEYKITYVLDDAINNPRNPNTYTFESPTITLYAPENSLGLSFQGWYLTPNFDPSSRISTIASGSTDDLVIYGRFLKYKVEAADGFTFDYNSYDYPALTQTVSSTKNSILLSTTIQVSSGCTWTLSRDIEGIDIIKTKNMSLAEGHNIAYITVWYGEDYNLVYYLDIYKLGNRRYSFVADGISIIPEKVVEEQSYVSSIAAPEKPGYTFKGWYAYMLCDLDTTDLPILISDNPATFPYCLNEDTIFLAIYTPNVYTATYDVNGGNPLENETENVTFDNSFNPVEPQREGYMFIGWKDSEGNIFKSLSQWKYLKSEKFIAQWKTISYSIEYVLNGGVNSLDAVYNYTIEDETIKLPIPSKTGYNFVGWFEQEDFLKQVSEITKGSIKDKKFFAKWEPIVYNIVYELDNGVNSDNNPINYTIEHNDIILEKASKVGYTFVGWYAKEDYSGEQVKVIKKASTGNVHLYAKFTANKYTITYLNVKKDYYSSQNLYYYSETSKYTQEVTFDTPFTLIDLERVGYEKTGWYYDDKLIVDGTWSIANDVTLIIDWKPIVYKISYQLNGGTNSTDNPTSYTIETSTITLKNPTGTHTFLGWYKDINLTQKITSINKGSNGDIILYAGWQHTPHEVIENEIKPTCTKKGSFDRVFYCSDCSKELSRTSDVYDMIDHVWNNDKKCIYCGCDYISQGLNYNLNNNKNGYILTRLGICNDINLVIPSSHNGLSVTSIGEGAFFGCSSLTSVTIPDSVTSIGNYAFYNCYNLTSVTIPDSVRFIGDSAFSGCSSLTSVTIPDSVRSIGDSAFSDCYSLTSVTIGNSVTFISDSAFSNCYKLVEVINNSPLNITKGNSNNGYIAYYAINVKKGGNSEIINQNGYLFYSYDNINYLIGYINDESDIILPKDFNGQNYVINSYAFYNCYNLTSVTIPDSVTSIGNYAFYNCYNLTSVTIPDSVRSIGDSAFSGCSSLTSVTIGNSVTSIGNYAFVGCRRLTSVTIGNSVRSIGDSAFSCCYKLVEVINNSLLNITKGYSNNGYIAYYAINVKKGGNSEIINQNGYSFYSYDNINYLIGYINDESDIILPKDFNGQNYVINSYAFYNCYNLTSVTIPDSVTSIGDYAFSDCISLTSVTIPDSVRFIGDSAFSDCISLTSVTIPDSVRFIGGSAFYNCYSLTSVTIPDSVTFIGDSAFSCCYKLVEVINNSSLNITKGYSNNGSIAYYAINVKKGGNSEIINQNGYLFYSYDNINYLIGYINDESDLILPKDFNGQNYVINSYAFYNCYSLTSVTIGNSVTSIGDRAFYNCYNLTSVTIGNSVTSIGNYAFSGCSSLKEIIYNGSIEQWKKISKDADYMTGNYTIYCSDGIIEK